MKMRFVLVSALMMAGGVGFAEPYDPAVHGNPIVVPSGTVVIDGLVDGTNTVIDGRGKARCATLGPGVTLKNFTLRNGFADWGGGALGGTLADCRIEGCTADLGGGAYGTTLTGCAIVGCTANECGAALGDCRATDCAISGNRHLASSSQAAVRGGLFFDSKLTGCTVTDNDIACGADAPVLGGFGAKMTLVGCTLERNALACDTSVCSGRAFYDSTVDGRYALYIDDLGGQVPADLTADRHDYVSTLEDGSTLTLTVAKQSGAIPTGAVTATVTKDGTTYAYAGGRITDGEVTVLPTCRTYGAPKITQLVFGNDAAYGTVGGETVEATPVTAALFEGEFVLTPLTARVGVAAASQVEVDPSWGPVRYAASKLPGGLKMDAKTGAVSGVPTKAGEYSPTVTVTSTLNAALKSSMVFPFKVEAADDWAIGTFDGGGDGGQVTLSVGKTGKLSGKWLAAGRTWKLGAASYARYAEGRYVSEALFKSGSETFTDAIEVADGDDGARVVFGGVATNASFVAYQNRWKLSPWKEIAKGFPKAKAFAYVPEGFGEGDTITLKVAASGKVSAKGQFASGTTAGGKTKWYKASSTAVLCPQTEPSADGSFSGVAFLYFPPKSGTPLAAGYAACVPIVWDGAAAAFVVP